MGKKIKSRIGADGFHYPYTSPNLVIDENGNSVTKHLKDINTQIEDLELNQVELEDDDLSLDGIDDTTHDNLNTQDKTLIGGINEIYSQVGDLSNMLKELSSSGSSSFLFAINSLTISPSVSQKGNSVNVVLKWNYNKNIKSQTINGTSIDSTTREKTYNDITANTTYTLKAISEDGTERSKSISITFCNGIYYGKSTSEVYDATLINSLTKVLSDSKSRTITVDANNDNDYIYYCLPSRLGTPVFNVGGFEGGFNKVATIEFTNNNNFSENYDIYKSTNANLGNTTIIIK